MLNNIKSSFMLKEIASYLREKKKLYLFRYNMTLQKKLDINIINYKEFSGKYKVGDKNRKGKEYDGYEDSLIFEGEYLNGKRKGYGKEYNDNKLLYEGEYLNNLRNGNGKEFNFDGKIIFKEEYKDGNWWTGKVYEYKDNNIYEINNGKGYLKYMAYWGTKNFEGEYLNGKKNGKGKEYDNHILIFEGEYLNGKKNGKGKEYDWDNCIKFEGEYFNGIKVFK